jgi:sigma-B regulation protein RsbU (phosphoserine phosphatase)
MADEAHLLLVDDERDIREPLAAYLARAGYRVSKAANAEAARALLAAKEFDLVLLDIMMPGVDGLSVLHEVRQRWAPTALPVIMATAKDAAEDVVEALRRGANDYVTKPLQFSVVCARIDTQLQLKRAVDRIVGLERDLTARNRDLEAANGKMRHDLEMAATVQRAMLPAVDAGCGDRAAFAWRYRPCDEVGGDILGVFPIDDCRTGFYLLDVSGHGVGPSLLSVAVSKVLAPVPHAASLVRDYDPVAETFRPVPPVEVVAALNARFPMDEHGNHYFTLFYGVLDAAAGEVRYVSAGHPGLVHVDGRSGDARTVADKGFAVGWFPEAAWEERVVRLAPGDRIYVCSDGLAEARTGRAEQFGAHRVAEALAASRHLPLDASVDAVIGSALAWASDFDDDVSVLAIEYAASEASAADAAQVSPADALVS